MTTSYSSAHLRERDQSIHEKYRGEIQDLEAKVQRLKHSLDNSSKDTFDAVNRGFRLAQSLGFHDVYDAQVVIDSSDHPTTFKEIHARLQEVEAQLAIQKKETEALQQRLAEAEENAKVAEHGKKRAVKEKDDLGTKYDALKRNRERLSKKYTDDLHKWRGIRHYLYYEDEWRLNYEDEPGITSEETKKRLKLMNEHRNKLIKLKADPSSTQGAAKDNDKENERTPTPISQKRRFGSENLPAGSAEKKATSISRRKTLMKSVTNTTAPSSSPTVFFTSNSGPTRVPLSFQPIPDTNKIKEEPQSTQSPLSFKAQHTQSSSPASKPRVPNSSDTEEDSQAVPFTTIDSRTGEVVVFKVPAPPTIKWLTQHNLLPTKATPHPSLPSRPSFEPTSNGQSSKAHLLVAQPMSNKESEFPERVDQDSGRPTKLRRLSENSHELSRPAVKPELSISNSAPRLRTFSSAKEKGRADHGAAVSTPLAARNSGQKPLEDYSAFKGRGRYGKGSAEAPDQTTINAEYTIDPARNGGLNFQYDEVVRNKDERKKMNAGDCECCREYYEGVGPLPNRLQQPMWRSPPTTPAKPCPRHRHDGPSTGDRGRGEASLTRSAQRQSEIESHKKAISRHRHTWARATTPPAYWDIGFPSTQEVGDINEKAKEMHKRKKEQVAKEAVAEGGRYRRK